MILGFGNNVTATLAADITSLQTTLPVEYGVGAMFSKILTSDFQNSSVNHAVIAKITLCDKAQTIWEICHLTAVNDDNLTVIRAQEGTTARGWTSGTLIGNFATRGSENQLVQIGQLQAGDFVYSEALGTDNNLVVTIPSTATSNNWDFKSPIVISPTANNTGAVKIQLILGGTVIGTFPVFKANKKALVKNDIVSGIPFILLLDKTKTFFTLINAGSLYELAQTTGQSSTLAMSQKACTDIFAKKESLEKFTAGNINIKSTGNNASLLFSKNDGQKLGLETSPNDAYFVYRDEKNNNKAVVTIPSTKDGTLALTSDVDAINNYPVGAPIPWPQEKPPEGYLLCKGQPFDKVKCPKLLIAYPSGILPDLRGEFIRGLSAGRKYVDVGRAVLSAQGDALQNFTGNISGIQFVGQASSSGIFKMGRRMSSSSITGGDSGVFAVDCSASFQSDLRTALETRPRNIAFLYIVRAA